MILVPLSFDGCESRADAEQRVERWVEDTFAGRWLHTLSVILGRIQGGTMDEGDLADLKFVHEGLRTDAYTALMALCDVFGPPERMVDE